MLIGVTGQIGAGKSTAAAIFKSFGAAVVDADKIGRQVVDNNPVLLRRLVRTFGDRILNRRGNLDRKRLAALAFENDASGRRLNQLVHPYLLKELHRRVKQASTRHEVVIIDAALLLDWNLDRQVDMTLVIHTSRARRLALAKKRGIAPADARARQRRQLPYSEYRCRADVVILNNGSKDDLHRKLGDFWRRVVLKEIYKNANR